MRKSNPKAFRDSISCVTKLTKGSGNAHASLLYLARCRTADVKAGLKPLSLVFVDGEGSVASFRGRESAEWVGSILASSRPVGAVGPQVRMWVISVGSDVPHSAGVETRLLRAGHELMCAHCPGRAYAMAIHRDKRHLHLHIAVENYDRHGRGLNFRRADLIAISSAAYTSQFVDPKGRGLSKAARRKAAATGERAVALAKKRELARLVVDGRPLGDLVSDGTVTVVRYDANGAMGTVSFQGQPVGVRALDRLVRREREYRTRVASRRVARATKSAAVAVVRDAIKSPALGSVRLLGLRELDHL